MSKLIAFDDLAPGMTVYEDWIAGTGTRRMAVHERVDANHILARYYSADGKSWSQTVKRSREFRYWETAPTLDERENTPWTEVSGCDPR